MNSVGFKIKRLRERKNISQEELAYKLDVSQGTLSKMENGMVERIDFGFMQKVCDYFEVDPAYFFNGDTIINEIHDVENTNGVVLNNNNGVFNNFPEEVLKNQQEIAKLIETQNKLIEKLLNK